MLDIPETIFWPVWCIAVVSIPIAVISGWLLGGIVGIGTIFFVVGIGPCVGIGLTLVKRFSRSP